MIVCITQRIRGGSTAQHVYLIKPRTSYKFFVSAVILGLTGLPGTRATDASEVVDIFKDKDLMV